MIVMRLAQIDEEIRRTEIAGWVSAEQESVVYEHLDLLQRLQILTEQHRTFLIHPGFREALQKAVFSVTSGSFTAEDTLFLPIPSSTPDKDAAVKHCEAQWGRVLDLVLNKGAGARATDTVLDSVVKCGLLTREGRTLSSSAEGRRFLLSGRRNQVWLFCLGFIRSFGGGAPSTVIMKYVSFIFQLAPLSIGSRYMVDGTDPNIVNICHVLHNAGVIHCPDADNKLKADPTNGDSKAAMASQQVTIVPTPLSTMLGSLTGAFDSATNGFIIVESNFKVYAYTDDPLHIGIIRLFAEVTHELEGLLVAYITAQSARSAFRHGLTSTDILRYMGSYIHPSVFQRLVENERETNKKRGLSGGDLMSGAAPGPGAGIPVTVRDQLSLWEQERRRVKVIEEDALVLRRFASNGNEFKNIVQWARDNDYLLWHADCAPDDLGAMEIVIRRKHEQEVLSMIRRYKAGGR